MKQLKLEVLEPRDFTLPAPYHFHHPHCTEKHWSGWEALNCPKHVFVEGGIRECNKFHVAFFKI